MQDILKGLGPVGGESDSAPANEERWVTDVHRRLKYSDASVMAGCQALLKDYEQDLLAAESVQEFLDVAGMYAGSCAIDPGGWCLSRFWVSRPRF